MDRPNKNLKKFLYNIYNKMLYNILESRLNVFAYYFIFSK